MSFCAGGVDVLASRQTSGGQLQRSSLLAGTAPSQCNTSPLPATPPRPACTCEAVPHLWGGSRVSRTIPPANSRIERKERMMIFLTVNGPVSLPLGLAQQPGCHGQRLFRKQTPPRLLDANPFQTEKICFLNFCKNYAVQLMRRHFSWAYWNTFGEVLASCRRQEKVARCSLKCLYGACHIRGPLN